MSHRIGTAIFIVSLWSALLGGCASGPTKITQFWPPAPDMPRIQYLTKISDSTDVVPKKSVSLLDLKESQVETIPLVKPYGIAVHKGALYICDTVQSQVVIYDLPRQKASLLKGNKGEGKLMKPIAVAVDAEGNVYVADSARKKVVKFAADGSFAGTVGEEDMKPVGVAVDDINLYILDSGNGLVRVFDRRTSNPVRSYGNEGDERGRLFTPLAIGLDGKGGVYVTNLDGRVVHFDRDGHPLRMFGKMGAGPADYNRPRSIVFDKAGTMYIVDAASQNVRLLDENFQLLMSFGEPGTPASLNVPAGMAVSDDDLDYYQKFAAPDFVVERVLFVVSQFGTHKISAYGLGKKQGVDYDALVKERQQQIRKMEENLAKEEEKKKEKEKAPEAQPAAAAGAPAPAK
ncbi:NHL repeat-containing protein [Geomonas azotofigens]|uniref:hypothetical protein n=1 Tax=Geomonas azotofigens TaxID=2843196 RepID=UPI001C11B6B0|nr:hypothetical protein [Geomonas azotofigens]MBU5614526.1 hypothetical protein [Geomonas azotofigens]